MKPEDFLRGLGTGAQAFGSMLPPPWGGAVTAVGSIVSVLGSLVGAGRDPVAVATAFESWARDAARVNEEIDADLARRSGDA